MSGTRTRVCNSAGVYEDVRCGNIQTSCYRKLNMSINARIEEHEQ